VEKLSSAFYRLRHKSWIKGDGVWLNAHQHPFLLGQNPVILNAL